MVDKELAAHLAETTIFLAPVQKTHTAEQVSEYLAKQRQLIANRIRNTE